jgi:hypothetical protein
MVLKTIAKGETNMKLNLSIAFAANPRTWPVLDGRVKVEGV